MDPHLALCNPAPFAYADFSVRLDPCTQFALARGHRVTRPLVEPGDDGVKHLLLFPGCFPRPVLLALLSSPLSFLCFSLLVRTVKSKVLRPLRTGRSDGSMVGRLVERPSPDPLAASIPIASFCLFPRLSDRACAHKYTSRIYSRLFSIHFNAQTRNFSRTQAERPPFTPRNASR